ncbi:GGDEF domain-containing protein [Zobellella iuensis]|uniref:diguanylate cyclase n=1 Tax=Zobellella iuensis TaxID=2803811 RepID=A0ABS1QRP3_9GAMM|nr:sensor domain-containing diguanylate cyclase [Zobellella iuensis]MBL1377543.1 diguanylate cyclase [Zobellella iuensis]
MMPSKNSRLLPQDYYLFGAILLLLLLVALACWFMSRHWIHQRILAQLDELHQQSTLAATTASQDLQRDTRQIQHMAQALTTLSTTRHFLKNNGNRGALQADLDKFGAAFELNGIWLAGPQGEVLLRSPALQPLPSFLQAIPIPQRFRRLVLDPELKQATYYYAAPIEIEGTTVASLLLSASVNGFSRPGFRTELLVTDHEGIISMADNPTWLLHSLNEAHLSYRPRPSAEPGPPLFPISRSPLLPEVLLLGPQQSPIVLASHGMDESGYQVHALADAQHIYHLAQEQDRWATIISLATTGSLWGGLLTLLTLKRNRRHRLAFSRANNELVRLNQQLKQLATTDALTLCPNRRAAEARLQYELANLQRYHHPFCIVMVDIDHFKHINDQHGHDIGDKVLRHFAHTGRQAIRETDVLARIGGEEFLLILPETEHQQGLQLARRLLDTISATPLYLADRTISISFSGGLTEARKTDGTNDLLVRADRALYQAKEKGRCRICSEHPLQDQSAAVG